MKKIISIIIASAMLLSTTTSFAASLKDVIRDYVGVDVMEELTRDVPVPTDISVKTQSGTFENGPLILSLYNTKNTKFSFKASIDMENVKARYADYKAAAEALVAGDTALETELAGCTVSGQFIITVLYPTQNFTVNPAAKTDTAMAGFTSENGDHLDVFEETVARDITTDGKIVITVDVKAGTTIDDLDALSDLYLTYDNNAINADGEYTVRGTVTGYTTIKSGNDEIGEITYLFNQEAGKENDADYRDPADDISATVVVSSPSSGGTSLGGGIRHDLTIMDGDAEHSGKQYLDNTTVEIGKLPMPEKEGYVFAGYYYDKEFTKPVEETFKLTEDTTIYIKWKASVLNETNHFAFIIGYPMEDGREEVRPENNMTREEIATVFYRLLKDDVRDKLFTDENNFPDVATERWSNKAISTVANGNYINGYEDGTFRPAQPITRAEFVTIAARAYAVEEVYTYEVDFTDVKGHWADKYINYATVSGWIDGYEDNTFKPDQYITRAEVMKIINHMLGRRVNEEGLTPDAKRWVDNSKDKWYYYEVIEATNFHAFDRAEGETYETWTEILENEILVDKPEYEDA
ncbi:MAG: S-layer homology domain-containing protein [Clostridia bacterium]|nr:S-layer homology domain-containing protein [Clostridia bacterium]